MSKASGCRSLWTRSRTACRCSAKAWDSIRSTCWSSCWRWSGGSACRLPTTRPAAGAAVGRYHRGLHPVTSAATFQYDRGARSGRTGSHSTCVTNIFTVDLEDWFHVCGVSALSRDQWSALPSRVRRRPRRGCSIRSIARQFARRSSCGMDCRAAPAARRAIARAPAMTSDRTATGIRRVLRA